MGRWVRFVAPAVVAVALLAAAGVVSAATAVTAGAVAPTQTPPMRISMYGDSVLLGARDQLLQQFAGQQVTVDAVEDRSLLGAIGIFRAAGPALGDVVVLDLGYNDVADPVVFRGRVDDAMGALAGVKRVLWLNQHDWGPGRADMNAELAAAAARYPNLEVIDWNAEVAAHPEDVYGDAIHLTPAGQVAMATLVRQHFDRYVASLTPTTTAPTTTPPTAGADRAPASAAGPSTAAAGDDGIDTATVVVVAAVAVGVVVVVAALVLLARRARRKRAARRAQRRASSSARSASGSVTGSRQAKRSQT